jgi:predicted MFS family arabinose efflux permease
VNHLVSAPNPKKEWLLLAVLVGVQLTYVLDFVIMMPLGPQLMRVFDITPQEFGLVVSSYAFAAGISGLIGAFFIDRFDRRTALIFLYSGFTIGTFLCAIAPNYILLAAARIVAGFFGGVMGATIFAIIADAIPEERRGAATGTIMSAFSVASIAGVPLGLYLAEHFGWHSTFLLIGSMSVVALATAFKALPSLKSHINSQTAKQKTIQDMIDLVRVPNHFKAMMLMVTLMVGGFTVIPYLSPYFVSNVKLEESDLKYIYLFGGLATIFSSRFVGQLADKYGKGKLFTIMSYGSLLPILAITIMPPIPLAWALVITTLFMVSMNGRFVPAMALMTDSIEPQHRGSFMSINSSAQQLASGVASFGAGLIMGKATDGTITHFGIVGAIAIIATLICIWLAHQLKPSETLKHSVAKPIMAVIEEA